MGPKKADKKPKAGATLEIDVDSFVRTRDSVVTGLATLQDAIQTLSTAYIKHTNAVLGEHGAGLDVGSALSKLGENPLLGPLASLQPAVAPSASVPAAPAAEAVASDKKERKKRQHDPNAPKRPLTPFFLYMQTARPIIANDLGAEVPKGAVSAEGTRRWKEMSVEDRSLWASAYKENLRLYNARMHAYKVENVVSAKDMTDDQALSYAESHNIGADTTADAQLVGEASAGAHLDADDADADADAEPEREPTPPPKTPKAKASGRKGKAGKATPAETAPAPVVVAAPAPSIVPTPKEKKETPAGAGKRKRVTKKDEAAAAAASEAAEEVAVETPKSTSKPRKKKAKADA